jgi:hypothetical protein
MAILCRLPDTSRQRLRWRTGLEQEVRLSGKSGACPGDVRDKTGHALANAVRVTVWQLVSACDRIALAAETGMLDGRIATQNGAFAACLQGRGARESRRETWYDGAAGGVHRGHAGHHRLQSYFK